MSEVATGECDGCAEEHPVQQLESVTLPTGQTVTCCPDCRYHAEQLATGATAACEGCGAHVGVDELDATPVPDGRTLQLCPDCVDEAASVHESAMEQDAASDGASIGDFDPAGGSGAGAGDADAAGPGAGSESTNADSADAGSGATGSTGGSDASTTADGGSAVETAESGTSGKPATTDNVCDQCGELFSIELYQVKTVDGRTEEFCPDCKEDGVREGLVRDVELRRAQAYEVLELSGGADQDEIRQAYLRRVKEVHPDRSDGNRSEFMLVKEAYDRLKED